MNWNMGKLLEVSGAYWNGCALQAGVRLNFFSYLGSEAQEAREVARLAGTDSRATGMLLDALAAMGLLEKEMGSYSNSAFAKTYLVEGSSAYMGHIILHHSNILDGWAQLDRAVVTGKKVERRSFGEDNERQSFLMGMFNLASNIAPMIADQFALEGRKKLLDLGGGPGTYAIQFCLANPQLEAVIFDRPTTEPFARSTVEKYGLSDRIDFLGGDFNLDNFGNTLFDVVWMSHILHSNSYEQCEDVIVKAGQKLESGGLLLVHDFILNDEKDGPEFPALFALNMLVGTDNGCSYSRQEVFSMLEGAGFGEIAQHKLQVPNDSSIIAAIKM